MGVLKKRTHTHTKIMFYNFNKFFMETEHNTWSVQRKARMD